MNQENVIDPPWEEQIKAAASLLVEVLTATGIDDHQLFDFGKLCYEKGRDEGSISLKSKKILISEINTRGEEITRLAKIIDRREKTITALFAKIKEMNEVLHGISSRTSTDKIEAIFQIRSSFVGGLGLNKEEAFQAMQDYAANEVWMAEEKIRELFNPIIIDLIKAMNALGYGTHVSVRNAEEIFPIY
jgi:hypothetical protein